MEPFAVRFGPESNGHKTLPSTPFGSFFASIDVPPCARTIETKNEPNEPPGKRLFTFVSGPSVATSHFQAGPIQSIKTSVIPIFLHWGISVKSWGCPPLRLKPRFFICALP